MWVYILLIVFATYYNIVCLTQDKYSSLLIFLPVSFIVITQSDLLATICLVIFSFLLGLRTGFKITVSMAKTAEDREKKTKERGFG